MKTLLLLIIFPGLIFSQLPETDIFLCTIKNEAGNYSFSKPENITNRKGYDNQPCFTPDNQRILYVSVVDSTQSDIYKYDLKEKVSFQVSNSNESEYSPAYAPDGKHISVVRVDADSGQRFYCLPLRNLKNSVLIKNTDSIGYACWMNDSSLAMFILGPANTLQVLNTKNSTRQLIASDIGRCMKLSPDGKKMFFVLKGNKTEWFIYSLDCRDYSLKRILQTLPGSEDFAVLPSGELIMGSEGKLYLYDNNSGWKMIADFSAYLTDFYRLTISNDGTLLALVAYTEKKP